MRLDTVSPGEHLIIPYAHASTPECDAALADLSLPHLETLLARWQAAGHDRADEYTLSPPHERALGHALGWTDPGDGRWPWAAWQAGLPDQPCAWFTPCHWSVGMEQVTLLPPDDLDLRADESQALLDALAPWAREDGIELTLDTPQRWRATGEVLRDLPCASLDRVAHRRVDAWLPSAQQAPGAKTLLRLQNEAQMLFYTHPVHDARQARGVPPINGFWISGAGVWTGPSPTQGVTVQDALRGPALSGNWTAWRQTWVTLDRDVIGPWLNDAALPASRRLVLCGEQGWSAWQAGTTPDAPRRSWWQRLWPTSPAAHTSTAHTLAQL